MKKIKSQKPSTQKKVSFKDLKARKEIKGGATVVRHLPN
jgi:hypothetical protein